MRLRTFTARTTSEAMAAVRTELGPDAIIVSTQNDGNGTSRVTAALDGAGPSAAQISTLSQAIEDALAFHAPPSELRAKLLDAAFDAPVEDAQDALATGLAACFRFASLAGREPRTILLAGTPGSGKTVTAAKLATREVLAGRRVRLVSTDRARAGGIAQLDAFARILRVPLETADDTAALAAIVSLADPEERLIIDTAGTNPFHAGDRRELAALIAAAMAEPVLMLPAGSEARDGGDAAQIFADLGCARAVITRLDTVQRLGSILAITDRAGLALAEAGIAPDIADGLLPLAAPLLAHLLLPKGP